MDPTPAELAAAAQKQDSTQSMERLAARMNLLSQRIDAELRLEVPHPALIADILTSLLAACCVREGFKGEQLVSSFRNKCTLARRFEKANAQAQAEVPEVVSDQVAPFDPDAVTASLGGEPAEAPSSLVLTDAPAVP